MQLYVYMLWVIGNKGCEKMSEKEIRRVLATARFKFCSDTLKNWETNNPILLEGEAGVVTGLNDVGDGLENKSQKIKFGDGIHDWNSLDWWYGPEGSSSDITVDQTFNPESENAQSGVAMAPELQKKLEVWQPNTEYVRGDIVFAKVTAGYADYPYDVIMKCISNHISPQVDYPNGDSDFDNRWECYESTSSRSNVAQYDAEGNYISDTYAKKEEIGNIETALDSIIAIQNSLIGGDSV